MNELPINKVWSGDGYGAAPITLKQVKRNEKAAVYHRFANDGTPQGYEVFQIKVRLKGQALPGGLFEKEDREVYPSANAFGRIAWAIQSLETALAKFDDLTRNDVKEIDDDAEPTTSKIESALVIPDGEFTTVQFAEVNGLPPIGRGYLALKSLLASNAVKEVARRKVNVGKGRATVFYSKVG